VCIIDSPGLPKWENFAECRSLGNEAHSCLFIEMSVRRCSVDLDGSGSEATASRQTAPRDLNRGRIGDKERRRSREDGNASFCASPSVGLGLKAFASNDVKSVLGPQRFEVNFGLTHTPDRAKANMRAYMWVLSASILFSRQFYVP
jgi:hypothetical protein